MYFLIKETDKGVVKKYFTTHGSLKGDNWAITSAGTFNEKGIWIINPAREIIAQGSWELVTQMKDSLQMKLKNTEE